MKLTPTKVYDWGDKKHTKNGGIAQQYKHCNSKLKHFLIEKQDPNKLPDEGVCAVLLPEAENVCVSPIQTDPPKEQYNNNSFEISENIKQDDTQNYAYYDYICDPVISHNESLLTRMTVGSSKMYNTNKVYNTQSTNRFNTHETDNNPPKYPPQNHNITRPQKNHKILLKGSTTTIKKKPQKK